MSFMEALGRKMPFFRWSVLRLSVSIGNVLKHGQVGDGREDEAIAYLERVAPSGDLDAAIDAIDTFAYRRSFLMNVGDEKGSENHATMNSMTHKIYKAL